MGLRGKIFTAFFTILALLLGGTIHYTNSQTTEFQTAQITGQLRSTKIRRFSVRVTFVGHLCALHYVE